MGESSPLDERVWESGWDDHTRAQRRRLAHLTFEEKLAWLEGAHEIVRQLQPKRPWPGHDTDAPAPRRATEG